jgi:hypothetical protein
MLAGAMRTAIKDPIGLHAMPDDTAAAMGAGGRQGVDRALETIKDMRLTIDPYFKAFVVHIPTNFASHPVPFLIHHLPLSLITHSHGLPGPS